MVPAAAVPKQSPIDAVTAGDRTAIERFCRQFEPVFRRWLGARWRGTPLGALVGDATDDVVFECLRPGGALAQLDRARCPRLEAYLRGVVRNVAARVERREARYAARHRRSSDAAAVVTGNGPDPADRSEHALVTAAVGRAVAALDDQPATVGHTLGELVRLHFAEGLAVRKIAARWHQPAERVHELRRRACRRLRRLLSPQLRQVWSQESAPVVPG